MAAAESVDVFWSSATERADDVLVARINALLGPGPVSVGRLCPRCASSEHGRPWARFGDVDVAVSVSRSGQHLVTAIAPGAGAVGVDVEEIAAIERSWPDTVLAPGERAETPLDRARMWVAKEAILKVEGTGLSRPMDEVRLADHDVDWLEAPAGYAAALVVRPPVVEAPAR